MAETKDAENMHRKTCFVIMGYGVKVDYRTGRELDLDMTYNNIIKPAAEACGLECCRADEIRHSGIIDVPMYEWLVRSDVVIADLSTYNPNAFYELGVRHALRPFTTIAISEKQLEPPFDVNHTVIRPYEHLGLDIGYTEVMRFRTELQETIQHILNDPKIDSPVYTFLPGMHPPRFDQPATLVAPKPGPIDTLSTLIARAKQAMEDNDFYGAIKLLEVAREIDPGNSYIVQKLVLATYKSKHPNLITALKNGLVILDVLSPETSTDTETLGLAGAIHKRLWEETQNPSELCSSINYYERGFHIKNDYYNGINLAYLFNVRASISNGDEAVADLVLARRIRREVEEICKSLLGEGFEDRSDRYWIAATMEEAAFGLQNMRRYEEIRIWSMALKPAAWERKSTEEQIQKLALLLAKTSTAGTI